MPEPEPASPLPSPTESAFDSAYRRGDFAQLRRLLAQARTDPNADRKALRKYSEMLAIDPVVFLTLGFASALFCIIFARYVF